MKISYLTLLITFLFGQTFCSFGDRQHCHVDSTSCSLLAPFSDIQANQSVHERELEKVGEGAYREVYRTGKKALKVLRKYRTKSYLLFSYKYPMKLYLKLKFGFEDFNQYEYENYQTFKSLISNELHSNFAKIYTILKKDNIPTLSSELIQDFDGVVSKSLKAYGPVDDKGFWNKLNLLVEFLIENEIFLLDLRPENILVRKKIEGTLEPVFFDYKRLGAKTYPFQFFFGGKGRMIKKMRRRLIRMRSDYNHLKESEADSKKFESILNIAA